MASLPETATYDAGIYQIEPTDRVLGGVNGPANAAAKGLANRTNYLRRETLKGEGSRRATGFNRTHPSTWYFNTVGGTVQGWTTALGALSIDADGALRLTKPDAPGVAAYLFSPALTGGDIFTGSEYPFVLVDVENDSGIALGAPSVSYRTVGSSGVSFLTSISPVGGTFGLDAGERRLLIFDMRLLPDGSRNAEWADGRVDQIRILPANTSAAHTYKIRRIALLGPDTGADLARRRLGLSVTLFVNPTTGSDLNSGASAATPLLTVAAAIRLAPPNMRTEISLADGTTNEITVAQFPATGGLSTGGRIQLRGQDIVIFGPFRPANVALSQPTLRFLTSSDSTGVLVARFCGYGSVVFSSIKVEAPMTVGALNTDLAIGLVSSELQTNLSVTHYEGALVLSDLPAYVSKGGLFALTLQACTVTFQPTVSVGKLLRIHDNSPAILTVLGGSVPGGVALKQLVSMTGASLVQTDNTPRGLLTNVSFA